MSATLPLPDAATERLDPSSVRALLAADQPSGSSGGRSVSSATGVLTAIPLAVQVRDYVSRDLSSEILQNEEEHVDTIEQQFEMIARMGLQNYVYSN